MALPLISVTELTQDIKSQLESRFSQVRVKGEITNFKQQSSGHLYFSLKDEGAQISAVLFRGSAKNLSRIPKPGDQVIVIGQVNVYAPRGSYQIVVRELSFAGVGDLLLKLHQLKLKLEKQGYFDPERKKALPKHPKTIGVITSPTGSVIQDIINVLKRRHRGFQLILNPVKVQGEGAAQEIAEAIDVFNRYKLADVLIVGRGGGSLEDLWPFNEECVAEAIYRSEIPIISAVGHETDFSIADYVADLRAPTPSAAAELSVQELSAQFDFLNTCEQRLTQLLKQKLHRLKEKMSLVKRQPLFTSPYFLLGKHLQKLDEFTNHLKFRMEQKIQGDKMRLVTYKKALEGVKPMERIQLLKKELKSYQYQIDRGSTAVLERKKQHLTYIISHLKSVDPRTILKKGYCIPFAENKDSVIISTKQLHEEQKLSLLFHDGTTDITVNKIHGK